MKYKRFLVLGTGVGKAVAYALLKNSKYNEVVVADINFDRAYFTKNHLSLMLNDMDIACIPIEIRAGAKNPTNLFHNLYFFIHIPPN